MKAPSYCHKYQRPEAAANYDCVTYGPQSVDSVLWIAEQRLLARLLEQHFPEHHTATAMDFACGSGRVLQFMRPLVGSLVGVDISQAMLDIARKKVRGVPLICADVTTAGEAVPGDIDIITAFRFLLLAEPPLRVACLEALRDRLRDDRSIMIFSLHGNPRSYRAIAALRNKVITRKRPRLPKFSLTDMRALADEVGLKIIDAMGLGFVPGTIGRRLPRGVYASTERYLAGLPLLWRFGANLLVICRRA